MEFIIAATAFLVQALMYIVDDVTCHGGMTEPPTRSIMWRYGFDTPVNYNWMALYCGGLHTMQQNNGKCGLCGDPYTGPFENDRGGVYDTGIIVRHYPVGLREIEVKIELTAHHKGYFQFKLCPNNEKQLTQRCLDRYPLMIREGRLQGDPYRYKPAENPKLYELHVLLPPDVTCDRCVLQWTYKAGNSVGQTRSGRSCLGCGIQETFVNCADISIGGSVDEIPVANRSNTNSHGREVVIPAETAITNAIINSSPDSTFQDVLHQLELQRASGDQRNPQSRSPQVNTQRNEVGMNQRGEIPSGNGVFTREMHDIGIDPAFRIGQRDILPPSAIDVHTNLEENGNRGNSINEPNLRADSLQTIPAGRPPPFNPDPRRSSVSNSNFRNEIRPNNGFQPGIPSPSRMSFLFQQDQMRQTLPHLTTGILNRSGRQGTLIGSLDPLVREIQNRNAQTNRRNMRYDNINSFQHRQNSLNQRQVDRHSSQVIQRSVQGRDIYGNPVRDTPRSVLPQLESFRQTLPQDAINRRADGMTSHRHAVRHAPHLDRFQFTKRVIREQVPNLPRDISPRQDQSTRLASHQSDFRDNWFPNAVSLLQERRRRNERQRQLQRTSRLPRRIVVHSMAVAQNLLRRYPILKGRVFLSRQAHQRNELAHMMHKYRRRQRWV